MADVVKTPCQKRSRDSLERILKAAEAIISSKGYEALTIAEVVRRSRTSVGTVYARFPDKDALLHALHKRVIARDLERFRERLAKVEWDSLTLEESVRALADIKQKQAEGSELLYEAFVIKGASDSRLRADAYNVKAQQEELEVEILMRHADAIGHQDPEAAIRIACRLGQAVREERAQRMKSGVPGPGGVPQDVLLARLGDVVVAYLKNSGRTGGEGGNLR